RITTTGGRFMSREYASPEQQRGSDDLGPQTDVFSLGVVAYRLFAGTHPFTVEDQSRFANGTEVFLRSPSTFAPEIPGAVERVIMRALRADPAGRHPHAGALAADLREAMAALAAEPARARSRPAYERGAYAGGGDRTEAWEAQTHTVEAIPHASTRVAAAMSEEPEAAPGPGAGSEMLDALVAAFRALAERARGWRLRPLPTVPPGARRLALLVVAVGIGLGLLAPAARGTGAAVSWLHDRMTTSDAERAVNAKRANDEGLGMVKERPEDAISHFRRAREINPDRAEYFNNLGYALLKAGRLPEAIAVLDSVIARYPQREVAHGNLGEAHLLGRDTARAIEHLEHYAELAKPGKGGWYRRKLRELKEAREASLRAADSARAEPQGPATQPRVSRERTTPPPVTYEAAPEPWQPARRASPTAAYRDTIRIGGPRPAHAPPRTSAPRDTVRLPELRR
ncbi:MAG TPA: tetratricopeptide repeat protein, partial [Longimicrobium sp.]|nr:tetratricopeptide repeat protein [Longimicrobium sp.]